MMDVSLFVLSLSLVLQALVYKEGRKEEGEEGGERNKPYLYGIYGRQRAN